MFLYLVDNRKCNAFYSIFTNSFRWNKNYHNNELDASKLETPKLIIYIQVFCRVCTFRLVLYVCMLQIVFRSDFWTWANTTMVNTFYEDDTNPTRIPVVTNNTISNETQPLRLMSNLVSERLATPSMARFVSKNGTSHISICILGARFVLVH